MPPWDCFEQGNRWGKEGAVTEREGNMCDLNGCVATLNVPRDSVSMWE